MYDIKKLEYESQLNEFLYPVYFKLLLIYQLDYNIPDTLENELKSIKDRQKEERQDGTATEVPGTPYVEYRAKKG